MTRFNGIFNIFLILILFHTSNTVIFAVEIKKKEKRIISLDYCADQYALMLADKSQILALSTKATSQISYFAHEAKGIKQIRPDAELILALKPDLVISSFPRHQRLMSLLKSANIPVKLLPYIRSEDQQQQAIKDIARLLGHEEKGEKIISERQKLLSQNNALKSHLDQTLKAQKPAALYITPGGYTSGSNTVLNSILQRSGITNIFQHKKGWFPLPLEDLIVHPPHFIISGFFDDPEMALSPWGLAHHDEILSMLKKTPHISIPSQFLACNYLFTPHAVQHILKTISSDPS